mmetsp:Transcript_33668/g.66536  ORF Transcript_33668/g.66536 Transcript_33668/m.66536 type:complete len:249 (+) Transcript_33668:199-945(+)
MEGSDDLDRAVGASPPERVQAHGHRRYRRQPRGGRAGSVCALALLARVPGLRRKRDDRRRAPDPHGTLLGGASCILRAEPPRGRLVPAPRGDPGTLVGAQLRPPLASLGAAPRDDSPRDGRPSPPPRAVRWTGGPTPRPAVDWMHRWLRRLRPRGVRGAPLLGLHPTVDEEVSTRGGTLGRRARPVPCPYRAELFQRGQDILPPPRHGRRLLSEFVEPRVAVCVGASSSDGSRQRSRALAGDPGRTRS